MSSPRRIVLGVTLALAGLAIVIADVPGQNPANPKGIDVSYWQGAINWTSVKNAGITFAIIRAGHGDSANTGLTATGVDVNFATNWAGAKAAGIVRGAYWFVVPSASPSLSANAISLATKFVNTVQPKEGDLQLAIDLESNSNSLTKADMQTWMQACVNQIKAMTHRTSMIYCGQSFWGANMPSTATNMGCPLWVANWNVTSPAIPAAWTGTSYAFWQYSSTGSVSGISGNVDQDTYNGNMTSLLTYTYPRDPLNRR
jgi:GH25 family lysozyme M1 (1,4-beta-N-acetylmuramidase)